MDQNFDRPVRVALGPQGNIAYRVERVSQAADILLSKWPGRVGPKNVAARQACLAAMEGTTSGAAVRAAFEAAAQEVDILLPAL